MRHLRVGAGVSHGEKTGAVVLELEVLVRELLAVDGATTSALLREKIMVSGVDSFSRRALSGSFVRGSCWTHVVAGEVTTLEHEAGDDTVETGALVALALGELAELAEVLSGLGDISLVEVEVDAADLG